MSYRLRPYQLEAVDAVREAWAGGMAAPALVLPTGTGKTVVFADIAASVVADGGRPLIVAHRGELLDQAATKLRLAGLASVGIVKAQRRETYARTVVASIQSLGSVAAVAALGPRTHLIVDEAHHATAATYRKLVERLENLHGPILRTGVTATMKRGDGAKLGAVWDRVVYERDILWMIRRQYLADVKAMRVRVENLDLDRVRRSRGDYSEADLGRALEDSDAPEVVAAAVVQHARPGGVIVFAPTVSSSQAIAAAIREATPDRCEHVDGAMPAGKRNAIIEAFRAGQVRIVVNCMVLTEGFDAPSASTVVIARPTSSPSLYVQMVGRVLRPHPGKDHALVLDVIGSSAGRLPLADLTTLAGLDPDEASPVKDTPKTLLDLVEERSQREADAAAREELARSELSYEEVHLFGESHAVWLKTPGGKWCVPAGDRFVALLGSDEAGWGVAYGNVKLKADRGWIERGLSIDDAMGVAESWLADYDPTYTQRDRSWRKRAATDAQLALARRLGLRFEGMPRAGEVGDAISVKRIARRMGER